MPPADLHCARCDLSYAALAPDDAIAAVRAVTARYCDAVSGIDDATLRRRPDTATWSALEYLCHVRDVYEVYRHRVERALTETDPDLEPMRNNERAERLHYNLEDPVEVLAALARNVASYLALAATVRQDDFDRQCTRLGDRRDVRWLLRQAAHEGLHHLDDIAAVVRNPPRARGGGRT